MKFRILLITSILLLMFTVAQRCQAQVYVDSTGWSVERASSAWSKMQPYYNRKNEGGFVWMIMRTGTMFRSYRYIDQHEPKTWVVFSISIPPDSYLILDQLSGFLIDNVYYSLEWMVTLDYGTKMYLSSELRAPVYVDSQFDKDKGGNVVLFVRFGREIHKITDLSTFGITLGR